MAHSEEDSWKIRTNVSDLRDWSPENYLKCKNKTTEILRSVSLRYFNIGSRNMHVRNRISIKKIDHRGLGYIKNRRRATRISAYVVGVLPCIWEKKPWPLMKGIDQPYHISTKKVNFFFRRVWRIAKWSTSPQTKHSVVRPKHPGRPMSEVIRNQNIP